MSEIALSYLPRNVRVLIKFLLTDHLLKIKIEINNEKLIRKTNRILTSSF